MDTLASVAQLVAQQPFTRLMNARVTAIDEGFCELTMPIREELLQQNGFLHGGAVSYAADNALTIAGALALGPSVVTSEFKINYLRPAIGATLIARATCIHAGKSQAVSRCELFAVDQGKEKLCAVAQGTIAAVSSKASR